MPRQSLDIRDFKYGVISSVDEEDIPIEAASDSLNVDGDVGEGILQGIPTDIIYQVPTTTDVPDITRGVLVENGGYYDLIYHDANANTINVICDFYDTNAAVTTKKLVLVSSLTNDKVTMVRNNKEVHIGLDKAMGKWIGYAGHRQFSKGTVSGDDVRWTINDTTGNAVAPIIVTASGHSLVNGNVVRIEGVTGNTAANGFWIIGAVNHDAGTFSLIGSTGNGTFGGTAYAYQHLCIEDSACLRSIGTSAGEVGLPSATGSGTGGYFTSGLLYSWKISLIYDGIQETFLGGSSQYKTDVAGAAYEYYTVPIIVDSAYPTAANTDGLGQFNKRITGINLYRADSIDGLYSGIGLHRKVAELDINDAGWTASTTDYSLTILDYGTYYKIGSTSYYADKTTYTENSGLPEGLFNTSIYYALSTQGNGHLFIGDISQYPLIGSARRYIIKSQYLRYDSFNYIEDFMVMPEPYVALEFYDGKLWAFSLNKTYRINPDGMYIEDEIENVGAQGQRAVHCNDNGMFVGNTSNAWMYQSGGFYPIGDAIRQSASGGKSWKTFLFTTLTDLIVTSDAKKGYVLFINERTDTTAKIFAWAYSPTRKRWDAFSFAGYATSANAGAFKGKDGEVYLSNSTVTNKLMRHTTNRQLWEWFSQELSFGETRQIKSLTMIKTDATGTVTITYGVDGATPASSGTSEALINVYNKSIRVKLNAAAATSTNYVDSMELIYRPLVGTR